MEMAFCKGLTTAFATLLVVLVASVNADDIFLEWKVNLDTVIKPVSYDQPVITINGKFPGPLINATTNDVVHVNVFNHLDEPLLFTWNGIQQRLNSWQDGVSGTNCPILPGTNWTYVFQAKDQIGSFFYFPSTRFQKAAGGFGPIRINNRAVIPVPFAKPEDEFDLLVGDWYFDSYKMVRSIMGGLGNDFFPDIMLMNGKGPYGNPESKSYESFTVTKGKTYRFRISNVGNELSFNFRIQNHKLVLVETEGSYTNQIIMDSLDVHVGQSYSVLVTADQNEADYYIVASPLLPNITDDPNRDLNGVGVLHYSNSPTKVSGPLPQGPDPYDLNFSLNQAKSIRWNLTAGAARPNPQGSFSVSNVTLSQTFILQNSRAQIKGALRYAVNNISYYTPSTPLKLADYFVNGSRVYRLDQFPVDSVNAVAAYGVSVVTGIHRGYIEIVLINTFSSIDAWHLDGFGFFVVGFGNGKWTPEARTTYNTIDPVVRSTTQVYPNGWTAVYAYLDNPGMWNLRSQTLKNWFLGQELYVRVHNNDPGRVKAGRVKERPPPDNLLLCGKFVGASLAAPAPAPAPIPHGD